MKNLIFLLALLLIPVTAITSEAATMRVFVTEFSTGTAQSAGEMKGTLQSLLASRLNSGGIVTVGSASEADTVVSGTYVTVGKIFSLDTVVKNSNGKIVARAFVQGESQDELIPAVGKLAEKLSHELGALNPDGQPVTVAQQSSPEKAPVAAAVIHKAAVPIDWQSARLTGAANLMAVGMTLPDGSREIFLAENQRLAYYRQGNDMKLLAEVELQPSEKIISLDTFSGGDGKLDIYVTIVRSNELASQVWQVKDDKLTLVVDKLAYFFRSAALAGGSKKLYAQAMGRDDDFYGDVSEATRNGSVISLKNSLKMPRYGNIYSFNQFLDHAGKVLMTVINPDGYLIVYEQQLNELWRSNDKFGGSELFFQKDDDSNQRATGDKYRWIFMNQRIQVSSRGDIIIGKNDGFWVLGNSRSYKRGTVYCLAWNGSSLEEKWHTRETQNYMPDYVFDEPRNELIILQTVQRHGIATRGASSLSIKKVE